MHPGEPAHNLGILDEGTLYVARFTGDSPGEIDGTGRLPSGGGEFGGFPKDQVSPISCPDNLAFDPSGPAAPRRADR